MSKRTWLSIVLAAGAGTRMKSQLPKVMHDIGGQPMIEHVLDTLKSAGTSKIGVVIGPEMQTLQNLVSSTVPEAEIFTQLEQLGTADAVKTARSIFAQDIEDVLILYGDSPLITQESIHGLRKLLSEGTDIAVLGFEAENPHGYGRIITEGNQVVAIREERDASEEERQITLCNSGIMGIRRDCIEVLLDGVGNNNEKGEFYLTDVVEIGKKNGKSIKVILASEAEVQGVNDRTQLAACESVFQSRMRDRMLSGGVTLNDPDTVFFSYDTKIESDVVIEQNVVFGPGVEIKSGATIRAFSHIEGATIASNAIVGPYARLRPGANIGPAAKIGNFVEIKNAELKEGVKVNHLSYVGDAQIGENSNIGAGTITCNYDGIQKFRTEVGAESFIGSNSSLVAPVKVGKGAYVASGSVITKEIPENALGVGRAHQYNILNWVTRFWNRKKTN